MKTWTTFIIQGLEHVNASIDALHGGECLRAVVQIADSGLKPQVNNPNSSGSHAWERAELTPVKED